MVSETLPTVEEAMAYANGYAEGLRDAKEQDVAALLNERDTITATLAFEKAARKIAERDRDHNRAQVAGYADQAATLRARVEELDHECQHSMKTIAEERARAEAAESRLSEATRLAVEALDPFAGDDAMCAVNSDYERARTALDRLNAMKGESE